MLLQDKILIFEYRDVNAERDNVNNIKNVGLD